MALPNNAICGGWGVHNEQPGNDLCPHFAFQVLSLRELHYHRRGLTPAFALTSLRGEMFFLLSLANGGGEVPLSLSITLPMTLYVVRAGQCSVKKVCACARVCVCVPLSLSLTSPPSTSHCH